VGGVRNGDALRSGDTRYGVDDAAGTAVRGWTFEPGRRGDERVELTATEFALLATLAVVALAAVLQLRARRAAAAHAVRAASLAARLKETAFARDTAEKSLELLEGELQHRMKQLGDAQQRAADAGGWLGRGVTKAVGTWLAVCHVWAAQCFHWAHLPSLLSVCPLLPTCSLPKDRHRAAAPACAHARQGRAAATPRQPG